MSINRKTTENDKTTFQDLINRSDEDDQDVQQMLDIMSLFCNPEDMCDDGLMEVFTKGVALIKATRAYKEAVLR